MKIALIYLGRRGAGPGFSLDLANNLAEHSDLRVFLSQDIENRTKWETTALDVKYFKVFQNNFEFILNSLFPNRIRFIQQNIISFKPDVLLFPMFHPWNVQLQRKLKGLPAIVFVHDPVPHPGLFAWVSGVVEDRSLKQAARMIVFSQSLIPGLIRRGFPESKVAVVPLGAGQPERLSEIIPAPAIQAADVLFLGRITTYKGLDILLDAFKLVQQRFPQTSLRIVGNGSLAPYRVALQRLSNVDMVNRWVGDDEIPGFLKSAGMLVLPYTTATQSGLIPLAAIYGLPVIATRIGGLPEQIIHEKTGLLVPPGDVEALAAAIELILTDRETGQALGTALQDDFAQNRSWASISQKVLEQCSLVLQVERGKSL